MTKLTKALTIILASTTTFSPTTAFLSSASSTPAFFTSATSTTLQSQTLPVLGEESIMSPKKHGTSTSPVQPNIKWDCDISTADRICNFNRHYAEFAGYWTTTSYLSTVDRSNPTKYYDSVTGKHLFTAPINRTMDDFLKESASHGWPSFRDDEVNWENVRCLSDGECVSLTGTHLGHNIPDSKGNRYCINLVCVAGNPAEGEE